MKPRLFNVLTFTDPLVIVTPAGCQRLHEMILLLPYGMGVVLRPHEDPVSLVSEASVAEIDRPAPDLGMPPWR
jgi:hypothetical protein